MARKLIHSHIQEGDYRRSFLLSLLGHLIILALFLVGVQIFPPQVIQLGTGEGGGSSSDFVSVGLAADLGGGDASMYKPAITPRPEVAPPPPAPEAEPAVTEEISENVFEEATSDEDQPEEEKKEQAEATPPPPEPPQRAVTPPRSTNQQQAQEEPGRIPQEPQPGSGGASGSSAGSGAGMGSGRGLSVGSGTGAGNIDSWYIRQVEQRVGQNWLNTSLGQISRRVEAIVTFDVRPNGQIVAIEFKKRSGINSVDLAVQRAIQASNPLPPLPFEFRNRTVRFEAVFEYPPR